MHKYFYIALFHKSEEGGFWVSFPDLPECLTEGDNMSDAYSMAIDAFGLAITDRLKNGEEIPFSTPIDDLSVMENEYPVIVEFDMLDYKKRTASLAVKKTLSIPGWMNEAAMEQGINFSSVLQEALKERLGL
ncbi:MAG: type II toxin-antitoxin system HicB family antitoxin [Anaerovoracaceae bacterium]